MKEKIIAIIVMMLLFATVLSVAGNGNTETDQYRLVEEDAWAMFHHDEKNTGYSSTPLPKNDEVRWMVSDIGGIDASSSVIANNHMYIGSLDGRLYQFIANHGAMAIPPFETGGAIYSTPAVANEYVYVGSTDGFLYCLNASYTPNEIWNVSIGPTRSSPTVVDGRVYIGSDDDKVFCFDAVSGNPSWDFSTQGDVWSSPAISNDKVYVGDNSGTVYCLDIETGNEIWTNTTASFWIKYSSPIVADGKVFIGSGLSSGKVECFDAETGELLWSFDQPTYNTPVYHDGKLYVQTKFDGIFCLDVSNGDELWDIEDISNSNYVSSMAIGEDKLFAVQRKTVFPNTEIYVVCIDINEQNVLWSYEVPGDIYSSFGIYNGKVYIGTQDGAIYCFGSAAPEIPSQPDGPTEGLVGEELCFTTSSTDLEGDDIQYAFDWGDGGISSWSDFYASGEEITQCYEWDAGGIYEVKVKAKDSVGSESDWSEPLIVTIIEPKLEIESITGGTGITVVVRNTGGVTASDVEVKITIDGGLVVVPRRITKAIGSMDDGATEEIQAMVFGFGLGILADIPTITVTATSPDVGTGELSVNATVFLMFVTIEE